MRPTGVYIRGSRLCFVQSGSLLANPSSPQTAQEFTLELADPPQRPDQIRAFIRQNRIKTGQLILGIPRTEFSVRYLSLPTLKDTEIKHMVDHEVAHLFPFKPEELLYDHVVIAKESDGYSRVMLFASLKETVTSSCDILREAGLIPDGVSVSTLSLYSRFLKQHRPKTNYLIVYLADSWLELLHIAEGKLTFSRAFPLKNPDPANELLRSIEMTATVLRDTGYRIDTVLLSAEPQITLDELAEKAGSSLQCAVEIDRSLNLAEADLQDACSGGASLRLVPKEYSCLKQTDKNKRAVARLAVLLLINLTLVSNILLLQKKARAEYLAWLTTEIARIETPASELRKKAAEIQALESYRASGRVSLALLSEIYAAASPGMTLSGLELQYTGSAGAVSFKGTAPSTQSALTFVEKLKSSPFITTAGMLSLKKRGTSSQKEEGAEFQAQAEFAL